MSETSEAWLLPDSERYPHEAMASYLFHYFALERDGIGVQQYIQGNARTIDLTIDAKMVPLMLPPKLYQLAQERRLLVEFESSYLYLPRAMAMNQGLANALVHHAHSNKKTPEKKASRYAPFIIAYVPRIGGDLKDYLLSTEEPGVWSISASRNFFVIDSSAVPSDSSYVYLKLLHVFKTRNRKKSREDALAIIKLAKQHSPLTISELEDFAMTVMQQMKVEKSDLVWVKRHAFVSSYDEGIEKGIEKGALSNARESIFKLAMRKDIMLSAASIKKVNTSADLEQLDDWLYSVSEAKAGPLKL